MENCMKAMLLIFAWTLLAAYPTDGQVGSGTIVVFELAKDKFVIAADSRAVFSDRPPDDTHCKIAAFKSHGVIFAVTTATRYPNRGSTDFMPSWNATNEARSAVVAEGLMEPTGATDAVNKIASHWERSMLERWTQMMLYHPEDVRYVASVNEGHLTHGIFAAARNKSIAIALTSIVFAQGRLTIERPPVECPIGAICATGKLEVFNKYIGSAKEFMTADPATTESWGYDLLRVMRLVDLTIAEDQSGSVHGPVDAVELMNDGTIRWRQKKDNCPDSQD